MNGSASAIQGNRPTGRALFDSIGRLNPNPPAPCAPSKRSSYRTGKIVAVDPHWFVVVRIDDASDPSRNPQRWPRKPLVHAELTLFTRRVRKAQHRGRRRLLDTRRGRPSARGTQAIHRQLLRDRAGRVPTGSVTATSPAPARANALRPGRRRHGPSTSADRSRLQPELDVDVRAITRCDPRLHPRLRLDQPGASTAENHLTNGTQYMTRPNGVRSVDPQKPRSGGARTGSVDVNGRLSCHDARTEQELQPRGRVHAVPATTAGITEPASLPSSTPHWSNGLGPR